MTYALIAVAVLTLFYGVRHAKKENIKRSLAGFVLFAALAAGTCLAKFGFTNGPSVGGLTRDYGKVQNRVTLELYEGKIRLFAPFFDDTINVNVDSFAFVKWDGEIYPGNKCVAYVFDKDTYGDHYLQIAGCGLEDTFAAPDTIIDKRAEE